MSINGTLAFVILWIVNALIALVYLLVGIFLYVPACDLKREQGEEIQYDNRRAFFIRFIVMVLCPVVGPAFFLCSYLIYKTVFRQAVDLEDVIFSKERVQTHLKADEERERNMAPLEESLAVSDKRNMRMLMLNVIRGDMQKSLESITMALNSEDSETSHYAASVLRDELNDFRSNVQKMYTQMQQETETETECEEMLIDYMNRILSQKIFTTMEQTKYVNMLEEAGRIAVPEKRCTNYGRPVRGTVPETSGFKKNSGNRKVVYASGTAARKCAGSVYLPVKTVFHNGGKREILRSFAGTERV